ncbi:hypothetical protein D4764_19G0000550 [Takifugu flavidus]|uniref:Peptidase A2 domain-containing protein n=1 Tax=Takifugu flavidus TaxID=433684 RepID=A0A5C6NRG5_9TELE|nr:hypothetical protein D4764_19G0000550 [Takifugu flavidus]
MSLKQGSRPVADYAIDFRTQARLSDWNQAAQCDAFRNGLAPYIKDALVSYDLPPSLDGLIELTSRLDRRIQARRRELRRGGAEHHFSARLRGSPVAPNLLTEPASGGAEPMQVGRTSLTPEERERRRQGNLCPMFPLIFHVSEQTHKLPEHTEDHCEQHQMGRTLRLSLPSKREGSAVNGGVLLSRTQDSAPCPWPLFHVRLLLAGGSHTLATFIDSGVDVSLIDEELAVQLGIDQVPLPHSVPASALDAPPGDRYSPDHAYPHASVRQPSCPSVKAFIHRCSQTWTQATAALLQAADRYSTAANRRHSQAPKYQVGQKVWLST